jgi:hypothetical protein
LSEPDRNKIYARLRRLPVDFLLALINATAILVIVAAILALVAMMRIDSFAGRVVTTMTAAVLSKIDLPLKDVLGNLRNLTEEVRTLGNTLREIKVAHVGHERTFASLFEGLIGPRSNLHSYFARANDLGKFRGMQWTTL